MADAEAGEFWGFFGGFAPLPKKTTVNDAQSTDALPTQLFCVKKGKAEPVAAKLLTKKLLDTHTCYLLDCGAVMYVWMGRSTSLDERKAANGAAEEYLHGQGRPKSNIIRMIENFETVCFRSKFDSWPHSSDVVASEEGRGKVAALLKRQGLDVKGLLKAAPTQEEEEEPQPYIDCSGTLQPDMQTRVHKEGAESDQFWEILGGKKEHATQKIAREAESDPHLFSCTLTKGEDLKMYEIYNFNQGDLLTEDVYILNCHSSIFLWVGQQVPSTTKAQALAIGKKFLERDVLLEKLSLQTPIFIIREGSEPPFLTRFFKWDSTKTNMHGNSFQRKLSLIKDGGHSTMNLKPKKRAPVSFGGRSGSEKPQRSRSVSFSPDRPRARGRSPALNALASKFDNPGGRNLSTPPPLVKKLYPKVGGGGEGGAGGRSGGGGSGNLDMSKIVSKSKAIASLTASFDKPTREKLMPRSLKVKSESSANSESNSKANPMSSRIEALTIKEDVKENEVEDEEGLTLYPYERLTISSTDPAPDIDVAKREIYLSSAEFKQKFGMTKDAFHKMPKWRQNKMKVALKMF